MTTTPHANDQRDDRDVTYLTRIARDFAEGFNAGDVDRLMQYYGARYVDVNLRSPVQTHAERRDYYLSLMRRGGMRLAVRPDEIRTLGDVALVRGTILITRAASPGAAPAELRYLEVAERVDGGWRVVWGMDGPVEEQILEGLGEAVSMRARPRRSILFVLLAGAGACSGHAADGAVGTGADSSHEIPPPAATTHDWTRFGWNAARTSVSTDSTGITAANVQSLRRQQVTIDGTVDASVIYLHGVQVGGATHNVFFVTTTYGKTLAIDADAGTVLWRFTPPDYASFAGSYRITNSTPVAAPDRQSIYAASPDGFVRKLSVADGHVVWSTSITLLPTREKIASPLNFDRGHVIAVTGGYIGDAPPYQGHVAILDGASGQLLHVWNSLCSDRAGLIDPKTCGESDSAIWGRAGAVIDTTTGSIYVTTGNARWNGTTHWGDAVLELNSDATQLLGNYTPSNTDALTSDADLGSTSPVLLDGGIVAQGGKDNKIRLLTWPSMRGSTGHKGGESESVATPSGNRLFTAPAVMRVGSTTWLFAADGGGTSAWTVSGGHLVSMWHNGNAGTSPVVAGGLLYVYDPGGHLRVYDPTTGNAIASLDAGGGHWNSPIVVDGKVALPEGNANDHRTSGVLNIYRTP